MSHPLENYRHLLVRVDALCRAIETALAEQITCRAGCSSCCTAITIFPVEAAALRHELASLSCDRRIEIQEHVSAHDNGERCPLLFNRQCLLYAARPIICRTHGLPIVYSDQEERTSDCCPLNRGDGQPIPGTHVIDLDTLNTLLVSVNALYLRQSGMKASVERFTIAKALREPLI
ncbi:MAG: YkgJ family cysteine cluster protein [Desulfuromonadales bacterium]